MKWFGARNAQKRNRSRSEYDNARKWTLVNDFTIHEDKKGTLLRSQLYVDKVFPTPQIIEAAAEFYSD